jgi:hypothetical protein
LSISQLLALMLRTTFRGVRVVCLFSGKEISFQEESCPRSPTNKN